MTSLGSRFAANANRQIQSIAEDQTLNTILNRSKDNNYTIDQMLIDAMKIQDPNRRNAITQALNNRITKQQELGRIKESNRILQSDNPRQALRDSNLSVKDKLDLNKLLNEQMLFGNFQSGNQSQQNEDLPSYINQDGSINFTNASDQDLAVLSQLYPKAVESEQKRRDRIAKSKRDFAEISNKRALPYLQEIDKESKSLSLQENAGRQMLQAIRTGNLDFFSSDNLANFMPENLAIGFRTGSGQLFLTSGKEWLLGDLSRAGARPNMWIEQQISTALPKIGTSPEAQEIAVIAKLSETELKREKIKLSNEIASNSLRDNGYYPEDIAQQVEKNIKPIANEIQDKLAYRIQVLIDREKGQEAILREMENEKKDIKGKILTVERAKILKQKFNGDSEKAINWAKKHNYKIPTPAEYQRWKESGV